MTPEDLLRELAPQDESRRYRRAAAILRHRLLRSLPEVRRRRLLIATRRSAA